MTEKLKILDLFSGIGGISLGLERTGGFETVAFCEIDDFCRKVLKKHWPDVPIYKDVRSFHHDGPVDVICGGYPCQPFSVAGKRGGDKDDRHLWPEMLNCIEKYKPSWVIGENVAGHISMGLDKVLSDLERQGYTARPFIIPACAVDAPHRRDRIWIVGHAEHNGHSSPEERGAKQEPPKSEKQEEERQPQGTSSISVNVADTNSQWEQQPERIDKEERGRSGHGGQNVSNTNSERGCGGNTKRENAENARELPRGSGRYTGRVEAWKSEPAVGRVAHGIPNRVDRIRSLGNSVVPQIPEIIGYAILQSIKQNER